MTHAGGSQSFAKALKETFAVYGFDLVGLLAGFLVAYQLGIFRLAPWAIALYPAVLGAKSVIDGLLSGRLSTALHLGTMYPRFLDNTKSFYKLIEAVVFLSLAVSVAISGVSIVFGQLFWGVDFIDFPSILAVVAATMSLGLVLLLVTVQVAFVSFKRALDPDTLVYPLMGTVSSVFITLFYIAILNLFFDFGIFGEGAVAIIGGVNLLIVAYFFHRSIHEVEFSKTIQESLAALMSVALIVNLAGTFLKEADNVLSANPALYAGVLTGAIYTVYPAIIGFMGDAGSVLSSTSITKLALGMLKPKLSSVVNNAKSVLSAWLVSVVMFIVAAFVALLMNGDFALNSLSTFLIIMLATNIIAIVLTVILSHALSILIFQKGLDPGNFVIPIENALIAAATSMALFVALAAAGLVV